MLCPVGKGFFAAQIQRGDHGGAECHERREDEQQPNGAATDGRLAVVHFGIDPQAIGNGCGNDVVGIR